MIISLYESNYPSETEGTLKWEELPDGYFNASEVDIRQSIENVIVDIPWNVSGVFSFSKGIKPRIGEHLLAVFPLDGIRYLCNSTLSYKSELDVVDSNEWTAKLGISSIIRTW